ncbi:sensor histidine kinase [Pedobacter sp. N23S346]|uniref:sensor histidine kinase n=1 Tax=Pedobacter sp. N23S346 TaxID=3402750 RepID=UPI003AC01076
MKLAQRYNRTNLFISFIILMITGVIYYIAIHFILTGKLDRDLVIEEKEIEAYVSNYGKLPAPGDFLHQKVTYRKLATGQIIERNFLYEDFYNKAEKENEAGRSLITSVNLKGENFQVTISKSRVESDDLVRLIFMITLAVTVLLLISLSLINRFVLQRIWSPFYSTLNMMKAFNITQKEEIIAQHTKIDEFNELNTAVLSMADRVKKDYSKLKTFTDNASHEIMTPLAIINNKLDLLLQGKPLDLEQGKLIDEIYHAVGRLSRLNNSLILLAKIENNLIPEQESVDLKGLINQKIDQFQELLDNKNITLIKDLQDKKVVISRYLVDILLNNLLSNAIRHNIANGKIEIKLDSRSLKISNTGSVEALDGNLAFERFYKISTSEGMGLGLAIVKQIATLHNYSVTYNFAEGRHIFSIEF